MIAHTSKKINYKGNLQHNKPGGTLSENKTKGKDASFSVAFTGGRITLYSQVKTVNGYASIKISNRTGHVLFASIVDMYSKFPQSTPVFVSPLLPKSSYILTVAVTGERPN